MRRLIVLVATLVVIMWQGSSNVFAHTLKVDGDIGVTMHISPEDEPIAQQAAQIHITITDRTGTFASQIDRCICTLTISGDDTQADEKALTFDSNGEAMLTYLFSKAGSYQLRVQGATIGSNPFQPFDVIYKYRVKLGSTSESAPTLSTQPLKRYQPVALILVAAAILILMLAPLPPVKGEKR